MSRSYKRNAITGRTMAESDKSYKQQEHRRERARVRTALMSADDHEELILPDAKEFGNAWNSNKDGKHYVPVSSKARTKILRK
jgi:hypothetical protein